MPLRLVRTVHDTDVRDVGAVRAWLMERVRQDVRAKGSPHPRIHLIGDGFEESLDLDAMSKQQPEAHPGATFQALRHRPNIERRFVVMVANAVLMDGSQQLFAVLLEEIDDQPGRRWWLAMLPFVVDPKSGVGVPTEDWRPSHGETMDPGQIPPDIRAMAFPPPAARAAVVAGPAPLEADIQMCFGDLAPGVLAGNSALDMVLFAAQLATNDLLTGTIAGNVVVRLAGREWEMYVLGRDQPATLDDMIRYLANNRKPVADAVALVQVAIRPFDNPPVPGIFARAEVAGERVDLWAPLSFPKGPSGPKVVERILVTPAKPISDRGWLGVDPLVFFELEMPGAEA
jgi:hypothetical protein